MKKLVFLFCLLLITYFPVFAQSSFNIDIPTLIILGNTIFWAGIAGLPVMALIALIKRWININGPWVIVISVFVSAGCVIIYLVPIGWNWLYFIILTIVVTLSANGIYLGSKKRNPK